MTLVSLAQPLFTGMPAAPVHGTARIWAEHPFPEGHPEGCRITVTHIDQAVHVGTHVDAPRHFYPDGKTVDQYELDRFVRPAVTVALPLDGPVAITADDLREPLLAAEPGDFVFLSFGYAERFREPEYFRHPYLTRDAAELLVELEVSGLGTDTPTPDAPNELRGSGFDWPAHQTLLRADVLIFENLGPGLARLESTRSPVSAVPLPIAGDGSLVAPYAVLDGERPGGDATSRAST